jgi:uncharacterized protein (TIGR03437 family)
LATVNILVGGVAGTIQEATLAAHQPGLYRIVFTMPSAAALPATGQLPLTVSTGNATIQLATIAVK